MLLVNKNRDKLSFELFKQSLKEKYDANSRSFYDRTFNIYTEDHYSSLTIRKGNTLPGITAFLFLYGSNTLLFIMMMFFSLIAYILEYLSHIHI